LNIPIVPEKPGPPNQPNNFCAPCAKKTTPSTRRRMRVAGLSSVVISLRNIVDLLLAQWALPTGRRGHPPRTFRHLCEMQCPYIRIRYIEIYLRVRIARGARIVLRTTRC